MVDHMCEPSYPSRLASCGSNRALQGGGREPLTIDLLAKQFTDAAHEERKYDKKTGKPYRVYHAIPVTGQLSLFHYVDIDEASRPQMLMSSVNRREQMVSDGLNLQLDLDHWNSANSKEKPIELPMDLTLDIEIRKAAEEDDEEAA